MKFVNEFIGLECYFDETKISYEGFARLTFGVAKAYLHRKYGPAWIFTPPNFSEIKYYVHGRLHRIDGPASIADTSQTYYLDGTLYSFEEWLSRTPISNEEKIAIKMKYGC